MNVGTHVRVVADSRAGSAFNGWRGTIERIAGTTAVVKLFNYPVPLSFGLNELKPVAMPTARVGVDFPGEVRK